MSSSLIYLSSGGVLIPEGSSVSGLVISGGEALLVASGGTASGITVLSGGALDVASGGTATSAVLLAGGSVSSGSGASVSYTTNAPGTVATQATFGYTGAIEYYTVIQTGPLTITVEGAAGGAGSVGTGGAGAEVTGTFDLTSGTVLEIITGGAGENSSNGNGGGGGGGGVYDNGTDAPTTTEGSPGVFQAFGVNGSGGLGGDYGPSPIGDGGGGGASTAPALPEWDLTLAAAALRLTRHRAETPPAGQLMEPASQRQAVMAAAALAAAAAAGRMPTCLMTLPPATLPPAPARCRPATASSCSQLRWSPSAPNSRPSSSPPAASSSMKVPSPTA
jgi:hypothetical protein